MNFLINLAIVIGLFWMLMQGVKIFKIRDPWLTIIACVAWIILILWLLFGSVLPIGH